MDPYVISCSYMDLIVNFLGFRTGTVQNYFLDCFDKTAKAKASAPMPKKSRDRLTEDFSSEETE